LLPSQAFAFGFNPLLSNGSTCTAYAQGAPVAAYTFPVQLNVVALRGSVVGLCTLESS
jgi:hypothetical protein